MSTASTPANAVAVNGRSDSNIVDSNPAGSLVRSRRQIKGLSIRELATQAGLSESQIYRIESGRSRVGLGAARRLSAVLGVLPEALAGWAQSPCRAGPETDETLSSLVLVPLISEAITSAPVAESVPAPSPGLTGEVAPLPVLSLVLAGDLAAMARMVAAAWDVSPGEYLDKAIRRVIRTDLDVVYREVRGADPH